MFRLPMLLSLVISQPLLAVDNGRLASMGIRFRTEEPSLNLTGLFIVLGGTLALMLLCWLLSRWYARRETRVVNCPRRLFRELCRAHRLGRGERELLDEIAEWHGLADPVQLFIEPQLLQTPQMQESLSCQAEASELHVRLFGR